MNVSMSKNRATSRHLGQRREVPESYNCNIATFGPTLRRYREA